MLKNFRTFHQAVAFYRSVAGLRMPTHLRDQPLKAPTNIFDKNSEIAAALM